MEALTFSISGTPVAKGRPRATVRGAKPDSSGPKKRQFATLYTDGKTRAYEAAVAKVGRVVMGSRAPFDGPLSVQIRFRFEPPKSLTKRAGAALLNGEVAYTGTKDLDNCVKALLDGLNKVVFRDDVQIVRLLTTKVAAEKAGVDVRIEPWTPAPQPNAGA